MSQGNAPHRAVRRTVRSATTVVVALAAASALAGCVAGTPAPEATPTPTDTFAATISRSVTPTETCAQLIDINTIIYNAGLDVYQGRMAQQEADGYTRIAARLVHRIDVEPGTGLATAVEALQSVTTEMKPGAIVPFDPTDPAWAAAFSDAKDECTRAGVEFYVEGFTGG